MGANFIVVFAEQFKLSFEIRACPADRSQRRQVSMSIRASEATPSKRTPA